MTTEERIKELESENAVMYAAILEASELGNNAAARCKVELQRIARNDASILSAKVSPTTQKTRE